MLQIPQHQSNQKRTQRAHDVNTTSPQRLCNVVYISYGVKISEGVWIDPVILSIITEKSEPNNICLDEKLFAHCVNLVNLYRFLLLDHLSTECLVSYCDQSMSVDLRTSSVVRRQQFASEDYSSYIPGPIDSKLGKKYRCDFYIKKAKIVPIKRSKGGRLASIVKICFAPLLLNRKANWLETS